MDSKNENREPTMFLSDYMKTVKIPFTDRLIQSLTFFFTQVLTSLVSIIITPFLALRILLKSETIVPDYSKIPVIVDPMSDTTIGGGTLQLPSDEEVKKVNKTVIDMFDIREPWKKEHDELYKKDDDESDKD